MPSLIWGLIFHWTGGLASASFYLPYRFVKKWSWETYWLVGGFFSWIIAPLVMAMILVPHPFDAIKAADGNAVFWAYFFGACWGFGGLTFGLTMRYLGIGLGMAVALSYCTVFGTLVPKIYYSVFAKGDPKSYADGIVKMLNEAPGQLVLIGILITVIGIAITGMAGMSKSNELSEEERKASVKEFNFKKGILVATFSGVMSACFSFGLTAGNPIALLALGTMKKTYADPDSLAFHALFQNLPVLIVILWGGFTTNFLWCIFLNIKNRSAHEYFTPSRRELAEVSAMEGVATFDVEKMGRQLGEQGGVAVAQPVAGPVVREQVVNVPMLFNYLFSAVAGTCWYFQFFFYSMGETKMGESKFASWTLHMASIIIFSSIWGLLLKEWKGTSRFTKALVVVGIAILVIATVVVGYGYFFNTFPQYAAVAAETAKAAH